MIKDLFEKALEQGLVPFMLAATNTSGPKKNVVRLAEIFIPFIIILACIAYYGGVFVTTLEQINKTQIVMLQEVKELRMHVSSNTNKLNIVDTQLRGHLKFDQHGGDD